MDALHAADRLESLSRAECLELLATEEIGRLAFVVDGRPRITPVNYRVVDDTVVFVSRPGAKLDAAIQQQPVVFEVDSIETWAHAGWSVLVQGVASVLGDDTAIVGPVSRLPHPWAPADQHSLVRVVPDEITGRRVRVRPGGVTVLRQE